MTLESGQRRFGPTRKYAVRRAFSWNMKIEYVVAVVYVVQAGDP